MTAKIILPLAFLIIGPLIGWIFLHNEIIELWNNRWWYKYGLIVLFLASVVIYIWALKKQDMDGNDIAKRVFAFWLAFLVLYFTPAVSRKGDKEDHIEVPLNK